MRAGAEINQINDPPFQLHHSASVNACYNITTIASLFLLLPSGISHPTLASTQPTSSGLSKSVIINCVSPSLQLESIRHGTTVQSLPYAQSQGKAKQSEAKQSEANQRNTALRNATQTQTQGPTIQGPLHLSCHIIIITGSKYCLCLGVGP